MNMNAIAEMANEFALDTKLSPDEDYTLISQSVTPVTTKLVYSSETAVITVAMRTELIESLLAEDRQMKAGQKELEAATNVSKSKLPVKKER